MIKVTINSKIFPVLSLFYLCFIRLLSLFYDDTIPALLTAHKIHFSHLSV